jgi:hypothetical protein
VDPCTITTIAGGLGPGRAGHGAVAAEARLKHPSGVLADTAGNVYIADSNTCAIRMIDTEGRIWAVAGGNGDGSRGDGGPAIEAQLSLPTMMVLDSLGRLVIADRDNHAIRRVEPDGTIITIAGGNGRGSSGDGGPATGAQLFCPRGLAIDPADALFVTDRDNNSIRRIDPDGTISTVLGARPLLRSPWRVRLSHPRGLGFDLDGKLHVADRNHHAIHRLDRPGKATTIAGGNGEGYEGDGGPATAATFRYPSGVVFDVDGNAYISDHLNHAIRRIDRSGTVTTIVGGNGKGYDGDGGPADRARIEYPSGLAFDLEGNLYIADRQNDAVRKVTGVARPGRVPDIGPPMAAPIPRAIPSRATPAG